MDGGDSVLDYRIAVHARPVPLVPREAIARIEVVVLAHEVVPIHLRDDGCCLYLSDTRVSSHDILEPLKNAIFALTAPLLARCTTSVHLATVLAVRTNLIIFEGFQRVDTSPILYRYLWEHIMIVTVDTNARDTIPSW